MEILMPSFMRLAGVQSPVSPAVIVIIIVAVVLIVGSVVFGVISKNKNKKGKRK